MSQGTDHHAFSEDPLGELRGTCRPPSTVLRTRELPCSVIQVLTGFRPCRCGHNATRLLWTRPARWLEDFSFTPEKRGDGPVT